jgi:hypothetical protein
MDINKPPQTFGVFAPVGHVVMALDNAAAMEAAADALLAQGFSQADLTRYSPARMLEQTAHDLQTASPMAAVGQELNLVKAHRHMAEQGCSFLVVEAGDDKRIAQVSAVLRQVKARAAQRYGTFIIEELVPVTDGDAQVFESPDTGLDLKAAGKPLP